MATNRILIIDDDESLRKVIGYMLEEAGYVVDRAASASEGLRILAERRPDLVLSDVKMPKKDGIELLADIKRIDPAIPVVILTAFASVETAVEAMKRGASDYLTKPIARDDLTMTVAKTLKLHRLEAENEDLRTTLRDRFRFESIIGLSPAMTGMFDVLKRVAPTDATVLITGESGTGRSSSPRRSTITARAVPTDWWL